MKLKIILLSLIAFMLYPGIYAESNKPKKPNILFILTDDQGWADLSVSLDPDNPEASCAFYQTPRMNQLALEGIRFSNAYSPAPICTPTRRSIQFGMTPARQHGTDFESDFDPSGKWSIAQAIKIADPSYQAAHFGKWGEVITGRYADKKSQEPGSPENLGYDVTDGITGNADGGFHHPQDERYRNSILEIYEDPKLTFSVTSRAISFMERMTKENTPFYTQVSYYAVHTGPQAKPGTIDKYKNISTAKRAVMPGVAPMLEDLDTGIGELLDAIDKLGIRENTYVFFMSDNGGEEYFDGAGKDYEQVRNHPLRLYKQTLYEGGIRVPMMVRGPGIKAGALSHVPVTGYDLMPTFYELVGGQKKIPQAIDGGSLVNILENKGKGTVDRLMDGLVFHVDIPRKNRFYSVYREGDMKLHITRNAEGEITLWELFDLSKDISESNNLAESIPGIRDDLFKKLDAYLKEIE